MAVQTTLSTANLPPSQLDLTLEELRLSAETVKALRTAGLWTLADVLEKQGSDIEALPGMSREAFDDLQKRLVAIGVLSKVGLTRQGLAGEVLERIDGYLSGRLSGTQVSEWAVEALVSRDLEDSMLLEDALADLSSLGHDDDVLDPPREDLMAYRECLLGKRSYWPAIRYHR